MLDIISIPSCTLEDKWLHSIQCGQFPLPPLPPSSERLNVTNKIISSSLSPESEKSMKQLTEKMEKERLWKKNSSDIQFSVRDTHVIIYKPIVDEKK